MFDSLKEGIKKSLGFAADKSKDAWEVANLKSSIWMLKKQRTQQMQKLGESMYEQFCHQEFDPDAVKGQCVEINMTDTEIMRLEDKIKEVSNRADFKDLVTFSKRCEHCGNELGSNSKTCSYCGK